MLNLADPEIAFAVRVVRQAMRLARAIQADLGGGEITKGDLSPVTVADFAVQALVAREMHATFPDAVLVGEESAEELDTAAARPVLERAVAHLLPHAPDASPESVCAWINRGLGEPGARFWTLDPIDGTKGYLRGGQYAIALALVEDGQVVLGALGCPSLGPACTPEPGAGALAVARRGAGAWLHAEGGAEGAFAPMRVSDCADPAAARLFRSVEAGHTNLGQIGEIEQALGVRAEPVPMDSQAKYAALAAGRGELLLRLLSPGKEHYRECIWDQAAGSIVLEEAGGRITDLTGKPLDFGQGRKLGANRGVFASNGALHAAGLDAIARVCGPL